MAETTTAPTPFHWKSGPENVQVTGSWDNWTERVALDKQADGTFSKKIHLPSNTKVHYKFIVDGNWTTSPDEPTANDGGNTNNIVDVGPMPSSTEAATAKAGEIGSAVAASVAGAAAATTAAAYKFADNINGTTSDDKEATPETEKKTLTEEEKKAEPAATIRETADEDIRNYVPSSITTASHVALPVIASAVATVTGADILRGNPETLPVTDKEIKDTQAQAMKGDNGSLASRVEPQGGAITDPAAASTENAKAAVAVANSATDGAPVIPVTNNGFAANVTAESGGLTTAADKNTEGGEKAAAVAAASAGAVAAAGAGGVKAATAAEKEATEVKPADIKGQSGKSTPPATAVEASVPAASAASASEAPAPAKPISTAPPSASPSSSAPLGTAATSSAPVASKKLPTTGAATSKVAADKANAPAAASSGPLAAGKETTTPAALSADKSQPATPTKKPAPKPSTTATKTDAHSRVVSAASKSQASSHTAIASEASSSPSTPDRKKKGLFGKIKQALSPATSPNSK